MCGYTPNCGVPELRSALADKFRSENRIDYQPEEIMVTSGASEALFLVIAALVDRGEEVLIGDPSFLSYAELTKLVGGRPVSVPLDDRLRLAPEAMVERITRQDPADNSQFALQSHGIGGNAPADARHCRDCRGQRHRCALR